MPDHRIHNCPECGTLHRWGGSVQYVEALHAFTLAARAVMGAETVDDLRFWEESMRDRYRDLLLAESGEA